MIVDVIFFCIIMVIVSMGITIGCIVEYWDKDRIPHELLINIAAVMLCMSIALTVSAFGQYSYWTNTAIVHNAAHMEKTSNGADYKFVWNDEAKPERREP